MADYPSPTHDKLTPLMVANIPNIDMIAAKGQCGLFQTIPDDMPTGSTVANLEVLGYDSHECFEGRGVLEAANQGIDIGPDELVFRCNVICVEDSKIKNHSAGHISSEEAKELIDTLNDELGSDDVRFYPGVSYRHIMILKGEKFSKDIESFPPHDHPGEAFKKWLIKGDSFTSHFVNDLIMKSNSILENHPINLKRAASGKDKANYIWPWSQGVKPNMEKFFEKFGKKGAVISAVDLINGIGKYAGFDVVRVEGATGLYDTNYEGKADAVTTSLKDHDFVFCHVEASDEAGHEGDFDLKVKTIEYLDGRLIGRVLENLGDDVAIAVLPDHFTPCEKKIHTREAVPFAILKPGVDGDSVSQFDEESIKNGSLGLISGEEFIKTFFN